MNVGKAPHIIVPLDINPSVVVGAEWEYLDDDTKAPHVNVLNQVAYSHNTSKCREGIRVSFISKCIQATQAIVPQPETFMIMPVPSVTVFCTKSPIPIGSPDTLSYCVASYGLW